MTGRGVVIVPAHNEAAVIGATLTALTPLIGDGIAVLVAPNGCTDDTAERAATVPGVQVVDVPTAGKSHALNAADDAARAADLGWPRLYLDADIVVTPAAVEAVFERLRSGTVLAARPAYRFDTDGCDRWVRAYYRARDRMPQMHAHLWGAGAYALGEAGHVRLGRFPHATADDLYVDELFTRDEIAIVDTTPVPVRVPRSWRVLLSTLTRVQRGRTEVAGGQTIQKVGGLGAVLRTARGPASAVDAAAYAAMSVLAKLSARRSTAQVWQRDDTTRVSSEETS